MTKAIVGLGNPGSEYADTRHNAGFLAIDALAQALRANYWKTQCGSLLAVANHDGEEIVLVKPQSFMNLSGGPVKSVLQRYEIGPEDLIVIHDEMDLEPGCLRVIRGGGHAGHNGIRSIHEKLGTGAYVRVRVGTGKPSGRRPGADFVLDHLKGDDFEAFKADCARAADAALCVVDEGVAAAMNRFNTKNPPADE